jgi:hypothetical protein
MSIKAMTLPLFRRDAGAVFSDDRRHRLRLWRYWGEAEPACFCMLNPSTADESDLDPTLRRCVGFAKSWGCGGIDIVNLFAIVSPDPKVLLTDPDSVGADVLVRGAPVHNNQYITTAAKIARFVVVGWGAFPKAGERARDVVELLASVGVRPMCLGTTAAGHPRHPLYLRKTSDLVSWEAP